VKARILLIDDDPGLSEVILLLLEREDYGVEHAATVKTSLQRVGVSNFDLVITDLKLPDGTGLDAIAGIRARRPSLPIISYSSMESAIGALRAGAVDYVIKPFKNEEFLAAIARALNGRRLARAQPLAIEAYIRDVVERFQDSYGEKELARMLGIGRKALWMRRRQWGLKRARRNAT
jgi:DNA-binding NtrC family response regulator